MQSLPLTGSCTALGCVVDRLVCHRCGTNVDVVERFVIDNPLPCVAGVTMKMVGHFTHGCARCLALYGELVLDS